MNNYLVIISRSDFSNLYKFGHYFLHNLVPFSGSVKDHASDKFLFDAVTTYLDTYEYSTEYLLLHIRRVPFTGTTVEVFVKDIVGVYALSQDAKNSLSVSLDPRINIQVSDWEPFFKELNKKQAIRQAKAGEYNCFEIFQIPEAERAEIRKILPNNFIEELYTDVFNRQRPTGNKSIWNYLVRYERHSPYWNDKRGFFSDAIHAYENYRSQNEIEYEIADEVRAGDIIASCSNSYTDVLNRLIQANLTDYDVPGCTYFIVAPLYLYLKSEFKEGGITPSKYNALRDILTDLHQRYGIDFSIAIALLGITLGHDLTYSFYYEFKNLGIFNGNVEFQTEAKTLGLINPTNGEVISPDEAQALIESLVEKINVLEKDVTIQPENHSSNTSVGAEPPVDNQLDEPSGNIPQAPETSNYSEDTVDIPIHVPTDDTPEEISISESEKIEEESTSFFQPIHMRKLRKGNKSFCKNGGKFAHTQEEYQALLNEGYQVADFFDRANGDTFNFS